MPSNIERTMIPETVEKIIREFDFHNYGLNIEPTDDHEWPPVLAEQITVAVMQEIAAALNVAWGMR